MKRNSVIRFLVMPRMVITFLLILFSISALNPFMSYDEGLWSYVGWLFNTHGIPPYSGTVENKTPAIFLLYTIADNFGETSIILLRALGVICTLCTSWLIYELGKKLKNITAGIIAMWIFGLMSCWKIVDGFAFAQTEIFMIFFSVLAFKYIIDYTKDPNNLKMILFAGLSLGMAINFKQIALTTLLAYCLMICWYLKDLSKMIKAMSCMVLGVLCTVFAAFFILMINGVTFNEYLQGAWMILLDSGSRVGSISEQLTNFINVFITSRYLLFMVIVVLFIIKRKQFKRLVFVFLLLWFVGEFVGVNASGYYYGHQLKQLLPVTSLITGVYLSTVKINWLRKDYVLTLAVFFLLMILPIWQLKANISKFVNHENERSNEVNETVNFIKRGSTFDDYVYVLGSDSNVINVLAKAERRSSSKYFHSIFINDNDKRAKVLASIQKYVPRIIIKHKDLHGINDIYGNDFTNYFEENYTLNERFNTIEIYTLAEK